MRTYTIKKGQYLSDILPEIESNIILSKRLPGIGATTLEILTERNSIIVVPNVPVIQCKCQKHHTLFGVHENVTANDVKNYITESKDCYKIMTTPESFPKIKKACEELGMNIYRNFFCLLDECHQLIKDVDYRLDIVLPIDDFFQFERKALVSATPLEFSEPRFVAQKFETVRIEADYDYRLETVLSHTNNVYQTIKAYLEEERNTVCFFINSVNIIHALIRQLGISDESSVFCAPKSSLKLKTEFKFENTYTEWQAENMRRYNFFTGRFFNAFDLELDYLPDVVLVTDVFSSQYTMLDIGTDCIQIMGRFRNGISSLTHIYNTDKNITVKSKEQIEWEISAHEHAYNTLNTLYKNAGNEWERRAFGEAMDSLPFSKLLYPNGEKNWFAIDNRINEELTESRYSEQELIEEAYRSSHIFIPFCCGYYYTFEDTERLRIINSPVSVKEKRKQFIDIMSRFQIPYSEYEQDTINQIRQIDSLIVEAFETLGKEEIERLDYSTKRIQEALILKRRKGNKAIQLVKNSFMVKQKYTCKEIEEELTRIYGLLNIHPEKKIKGSMILDYFQALPVKVRGNRGYLIVSELI